MRKQFRFTRCARLNRGVAACIILTASSLASCMASDPALDQYLNLFIKKGFVTQQEVDKVKAETEAMHAKSEITAPGDSKWKINDAIKNVELFGDIRLRYEGRTAEDPYGGKISLDRLRYAVRLGLRGKAYDDFYYGLRVETADNPRSSWVMLGSSSSGTPYQGPFGKSTSGINIGQVYLGWRPTSWFEVTAGKMPQPLYTTSMVWDGDLNPEGLAEHFKYTVGEADFFATFGQFIYQDTNPTKSSPGFFNFLHTDSNLPFLLAWQAGVNYHITKDLSVRVAPVLYNYTGRGINNTSGSNLTPDYSGIFVGQGVTNGVNGGTAGYSGYPNGAYNGFAANQTGINNLLVLEIPAEINYRMDRMNLRVFGDYAQNLQGSDRAQAAFEAQDSPQLADVGLARIPSAQTGDNKAYQIGFAIGSSNALGLVSGSVSRKHAWELRAYWQHVEQYALDPNLLDSDFFEGRANMQGVYTAIAYGLTDNVIGTLRYGHASRINDKLGTGGSNQDLPQMNPIDTFDLLQVDLTFRF